MESEVTGSEKEPKAPAAATEAIPPKGQPEKAPLPPEIRVATKDEVVLALKGRLGDLGFEALPHRDEVVECVTACGFTMLQLGRLVNSGFLEAPASAKHHLARRGGLLEHSVNVARELIRLTRAYGCRWSRQSSPFVVGLLHDFVKVGLYVKAENGYAKAEHPWLPGHGIASAAFIGSQLAYPLMQDELCAIVGHMGAFDGVDTYDNALRPFPLQVILTHTADMVASQVIEAE